jgi:NAD(P)-dependent dehydrogenase (short-subunit alcohol dehydrogenase family)
VKDLVVIVTGASRGIGAATARLLASQGAKVVLAARSAEALFALEAELSRRGQTALAVPTDVTDPYQLDRLVERTLEVFGRVDILINNAGIGDPSEFARTPDELVDRLFETNLLGPIRLTRRVLPHMLARRSGHVIFVSSVAGHIPIPPLTIYSVTKAGLLALAESLRREVGPLGIRVSVVSPGFIRTDMVEAGGVAPAWIPIPGPELVAGTVASLIRRPRRHVLTPWYYWPLVALNTLAPGLVDLGLRLFWSRRPAQAGQAPGHSAHV